MDWNKLIIVAVVDSVFLAIAGYATAKIFSRGRLETSIRFETIKSGKSSNSVVSIYLRNAGTRTIRSVTWKFLWNDKEEEFLYWAYIHAEDSPKKDLFPGEEIRIPLVHQHSLRGLTTETRHHIWLSVNKMKHDVLLNPYIVWQSNSS